MGDMGGPGLALVAEEGGEMLLQSPLWALAEVGLQGGSSLLTFPYPRIPTAAPHAPAGTLPSVWVTLGATCVS